MNFCNSRVNTQEEYVFEDDNNYEDICLNCHKVFASHYVSFMQGGLKCHSDPQFNAEEWFQINTLDAVYFKEYQGSMGWRRYELDHTLGGMLGALVSAGV